MTKTQPRILNIRNKKILKNQRNFVNSSDCNILRSRCGTQRWKIIIESFLIYLVNSFTVFTKIYDSLLLYMTFSPKVIITKPPRLVQSWKI